MYLINVSINQSIHQSIYISIQVVNSCNYSQIGERESFFGFLLPVKYAVWIELIVIQAGVQIEIFCNFVYFKSIGEKICILFTNLGKEYAFSPLFIIFFP